MTCMSADLAGSSRSLPSWLSPNSPLPTPTRTNDQGRAGDPGELGLSAGPFGHRRPRPAGADREPLEQADGQVRRADPDHLAIPADLLPGAGRERRRVLR
jgi:hypothetical protein